MTLSDPIEPAGQGAWTEPGVFPAAPGVHRIPLPMPSDGLRAVNVYAIEDGDRLVLIDGGWAVPEGRAALDAALAALDTDARAITRVLVTHAHRDHYTLAVQLRQDVGARVGLGAGERPNLHAITTRQHGPLGAQARQLRAAGAGDLADTVMAGASQAPPAPGYDQPDDWLEPGAVELAGRALEVVPTPGHTRGHIVFHDAAARLCFAGDHVLPHITPSIGFEPAPVTSPLADFLSSLRALRAGPDAQLLPAHGPPGPSVHARIDELIAHHDTRLDEIAAAVASLESPTAAEVAAAVAWTRRQRRYHDLDPFNQMLAVGETVAHLTVLIDAGRITAAAHDEVLHYSIPPAH